MKVKGEGAELLRALAKKVVLASVDEGSTMVINAADMRGILWAATLVDDGNVVWTVEGRNNS